MSQTVQLVKKERITHSPTLNTILMIEDILKNSGELLTIADIKKSIPRKVMHQTLLQVIDYLQMSGKIIIGTKGILWVFTERKEISELLQRGTEV